MTFPENFTFPGFPDPVGTLLIWQAFGPRESPYGINGQITVLLHNYKCRQFHRTLNRTNLSISFGDKHSTKSGPYWCQIWQVSGQWAFPYGANGQMTMTLHNLGLDNSTELWTEKIHPGVSEICILQSLAATCSPARIGMTSPLNPRRVKMCYGIKLWRTRQTLL